MLRAIARAIRTAPVVTSGGGLGAGEACVGGAGAVGVVPGPGCRGRVLAGSGRRGSSWRCRRAPSPRPGSREPRHRNGAAALTTAIVRSWCWAGRTAAPAALDSSLQVTPVTHEVAGGLRWAGVMANRRDRRRCRGGRRLPLGRRRRRRRLRLRRLRRRRPGPRRRIQPRDGRPESVDPGAVAAREVDVQAPANSLAP